MKIMHVSPIEEHSCFSYLIRRQEKKHEVIFVRLSMTDEHTEHEIEESMGNRHITIFGVKRNHDQSYDDKLRQTFDTLLKRHMPDMIHIHAFSGVSLLPIINVACSLSIKRVVTLHDHSLVCTRGIMYDGKKTCIVGSLKDCRCHECVRFSKSCGKTLDEYNTDREDTAKAILSRCDAVICPSMQQKNELERLLGRGKNLKCIHYGVNVEKGRVMHNHGRTRFGFLGLLSDSKGIDTIMDARRGLNGDSDLVVGTSDINNPKLEQLESQGVKVIKSIGYDDLYSRFFSKIDYLIIPSKWNETGPMVLLEALCIGIPVLISDMDSMKEKVVEGKNAMVFRDVEELRSIMEGIIDGKIRLDGNHKKPKGREEYFKEVENLYESCFGKIKRMLFLKLGYICNNNCLFCVTGNNRPKDFIDFGILRKKLIRDVEDYDEVILSGGEPTIKKDFFDIMEIAFRMGYKIKVQTNARMMSYPGFSKRLAKYNASFSVFLCGHDDKMHDNITGVKGSFRQTLKGIENLKHVAESMEGKIMITKKNYRYLPKICRLYANMGIEDVRVVFLTPLGSAKRNFDEIFPLYSDITPFLKESMNFLDKEGIDFRTEGIPYCFIEEKYFTNIAEYLEQCPFEGSYPRTPDQDYNCILERKRQKTKFAICKECKHFDVCEGVYTEYAKRMGNKGFKPLRDLPEEVKFQVTRECNMNCSFCFNKNTEPGDEISTDDAMSVIDDVERAGIKAIRFTGGEPLLRNDIKKLLKHAKRKGIYVILNTNGKLLEGDGITALVDVDDVLISFHDISESKSKSRLFKRIRKAFPDIMLRSCTIATKDNIGRIEEFYRFFKNNRVDDWFMLRPVPVPDNKNPISVEDAKKLVDKMTALNGKYMIDSHIANALPFCSHDPEKVSDICVGGRNDDGRTRIIVESDGSIKPSYFSGLILGNIGDDSILDCWNSKAMKDIRGLKNLPDKCRRCNYVKRCMGGLRFAAEAVNGSKNSEDPLMGKEIDATVVIPTYNRKEKLRLVLKSLEWQDYPKDKFEIIVVDDGSTDGTKDVVHEVAKHHPVRIRYIAQEKDGFRVGQARNLGAREAASRNIIFINDDVVASPGLVRNHIMSLKNADAVLGYCASYGTDKEYDLNYVKRKIYNNEPMKVISEFRDAMFASKNMSDSKSNRKLWH
ncbi:MAG: hypothetical protein DRO99_01370, partial [Candidatus Aenigmatarchaeota archaeon]